jgi:hypothetical protein
VAHVRRLKGEEQLRHAALQALDVFKVNGEDDVG